MPSPHLKPILEMFDTLANPCYTLQTSPQSLRERGSFWNRARGGYAHATTWIAASAF